MKVKLTVDGPLGTAGEIVDTASVAEARIAVIDGFAEELPPPPDKPKAPKKPAAKKTAKKKK